MAFHAKNESLGERLVRFSAELVIERADFRERGADAADDAMMSCGFQGLTVGGAVGLIGAPFVLTCDEYVAATPAACAGQPASAPYNGYDGAAVLKCRLAPRATAARPKSNVHWLSLSAATPVKSVRLIGPLLLPEEEGAEDAAWGEGGGGEDEGGGGVGAARELQVSLIEP